MTAERAIMIALALISIAQAVWHRYSTSKLINSHVEAIRKQSNASVEAGFREATIEGEKNRKERSIVWI